MLLGYGYYFSNKNGIHATAGYYYFNSRIADANGTNASTNNFMFGYEVSLIQYISDMRKLGNITLELYQFIYLFGFPNQKTIRFIKITIKNHRPKGFRLMLYCFFGKSFEIKLPPQFISLPSSK